MNAVKSFLSGLGALLLALVVHAAGVICLLLWLLSSDLLFGHFSGPMGLLQASAALLAVGAVLVTCVCVVRLRTPDPLSWAKRLALGAWLLVALGATLLGEAVWWSEVSKYHDISQRYIQGLQSSNADYRLSAAHMLWAYGPLVAEAEPTLIKVAHDDPDPRVREAAAEAIESIHGNKYPKRPKPSD